MKIQLLCLIIFLVLFSPVMAQESESERATDGAVASETDQTPALEQATEPDRTKAPAKAVQLPTIPDYLPPNEKALFSSAYSGDLPGVMAALAKGASVNVADQKKRSALMLAASNGHNSVVEYLISEGAEINARDGDNQTALIYASKRSFNAVAAALLRSGAEVNVQSKKKGVSALMLAAVWNNVKLVNMLLQHGADANLTDIFGRTAVVLAKKKGNTAVIEILSSSDTTEAGT